MHITIIHGQSHKGSTYHIARMLSDQLGGEVTEFFLPKDFDSFCVGCTKCFAKSETLCPHFEKLKLFTDSMDRSDIIILASPVYVYHATGSMKVFLDHYGYRWMVHRPEPAMFAKQAVCISTAAGGGMKSTTKDMADSTFFWGARTYRYGVAVFEVCWDRVSGKRKRRIEKRIAALAVKLKKRCGRVKPSFKTKAFFNLMRLAQKTGWNEVDAIYWKQHGWTEKKRPWKN